ncbi:MAG TPA: GNAT family N-acetyltransferase [Candidatus Saccharimonadales bacterium]|nr:GNAT family N-acetyltransferase [Candidatus Saccharimonadales bacterium]
MDELNIRKLEKGDEKDLVGLLKLYVEVFGDHDYPTDAGYLPALLENKAIMFVVAYSAGEVVGGLTAYVLPSIYGDYSDVYIFDMAVSTSHQRRGVGSQLLGFLKKYCRSIGVPDIFVQADAEDVHARDFYKKNGGAESDVRHYDFELS